MDLLELQDFVTVISKQLPEDTVSITYSLNVLDQDGANQRIEFTVCPSKATENEEEK